MKESAIQSRILRELNRTDGCKAVKYPSMGFGEKGTPVIVGSYLGCMFAIEVKAPGGRLTPLQEHRLTEWRGSGAVAVVAGDGFDVDEFLRGVRKSFHSGVR
jgi:hypothetical protein